MAYITQHDWPTSFRMTYIIYHSVANKRQGRKHARAASADPGSFVRGGPTLTSSFFFLVDEGREDPDITAGHHRHTIETRWRADDGQTLNTSLVTL